MEVSTVQGLKIDFYEEFFQLKMPGSIPFSSNETELINEEINILLTKGAIIPTSHEGELISNIFFVKKKNGKFRPVINLKNLNNMLSIIISNKKLWKLCLPLFRRMITLHL